MMSDLNKSTFTLEIRDIHNEKYESNKSHAFIVPSGSKIQINVDKMIACRRLCIYSDHHLKTKVTGNSFKPLKLLNEGGNIRATLTLKRRGTNIIYACYNGNTSIDESFFTSHIVVDGSSSEENAKSFDINSLCIQTHLMQSMGEFSNWENMYRFSKVSGYNCIHITPVNELSSFGSAFAIKNTSKLHPSIFNKSETWNDLKNFVSMMKDKYSIVTICDLVPNHCSTESQKLKKKPNIFVNLQNHPFLRPDFHLDLCILKASKILSGTNVNDKSIVEKVEGTLRKVIKDQYLHEYFILDTKKESKRFEKYSNNQMKFFDNKGEKTEIVLDDKFQKFSRKINSNRAKFIFNNKSELRSWIDKYNANQIKMCKENIEEAIKNTILQFKWLFLDPHGPKISPKISYPNLPLARPYFFTENYDQFISLLDEENNLFSLIEMNSTKIFANNGWVMNSDENFHKLGSSILFRRELNVWSDLVKYNFSSTEYLNIIDKYSKLVSETFHGIRLDNCHSTPIEIVKRIIENCRQNNPKCIVLAELFVFQDKIDHMYFSLSGMDLLVRELQNCSTPKQYSDMLNSLVDQRFQIGNFYSEFTKHAYVNILPNVLYDQTHDNKAIPIDNLVAISSLQAMNIGPIGSTRGVDDQLQFKIDINQTKVYQTIDEIDIYAQSFVKFRRYLLEIHRNMHTEGFYQSYSEISSVSDDVQVITRINPITNERIIAFIYHKNIKKEQNREIFEFDIEYHDDLTILLEASSQIEEIPDEILQDDRIIRPQTALRILVNFDEKSKGLDESKFIKDISINESKNSFKLSVDGFKSGSVLIIRLDPNNSKIKTSIEYLNNIHMDQIDGKTNNIVELLRNIISKLKLEEINQILFSVDIEEQNNLGYGIYNIPNSHDKLPFAGLRGLKTFLENISQFGDFSTLGHPICDNIRQGDWLAKHQINRLKGRGEAFQNLISILEKIILENYVYIPRYAKPKYFAKIINILCNLFEERLKININKTILSDIYCLLSVTSVQFFSSSENEKFYRRNLKDLKLNLQTSCTLAAGMPHFVSGLFRAWGRDTFISLKGLLLNYGRFDEAKNIILLFGSSLKDGLIPNLLGDAFNNAKYNSRDAVWWWLKSIQDFCELQKSESILDSKLILNHDPDAKVFSLGSLIHRCLEAHTTADSDHSVQSIFVDKSNGFVKGGTWHDAGTWMDKCDDSEKRRPSTPRDGAAIELQALLYSVLLWFSSTSFALHNSEFLTVKWTDIEQINLIKWAELIKKNFTTHFLISTPNPKGGEKLLFFKDTSGSSSEFADCQIRPNQTLAMHICPQLFTTEIASEVWKNVDDLLCDSGKNQSQIGIKTLNPLDPFYRSYYSMSDNYDDPMVHRGRSYHNGPEWVWVRLYHLCAMIKILGQSKSNWDFILLRCRDEIVKFEFKIRQNFYTSLEELTNADGAFCEASCQSQAWSIAAFSDFIKASYDFVDKIEQ